MLSFRIIKVVLFAYLFLSLAGEVRSEAFLNATPKTCISQLSLEDFLAIGLSLNPEVAKIDRDYADGLARAIETEVLGNPELSIEKTFTNTDLGRDDDPQTNLSIGQPLKLSDFGAKSRVAKLLRRSESLNKRVQLLELSLKLIMQYSQLYALQRVDEILTDAESRSAKKVSLIKKGVIKGLFTLGDEKLFEGEMYRLQAERKGVAASILKLQQELSDQLNLKCLVVASQIKPFAELPEVAILVERARQSELSEVNRVSLTNQLSQESQRLAELDIYQVTPKFIYQHTNDGGDFYGAGFTIPLPVWNRNQGQQLRTTAEQKLSIQKKQTLSGQRLEVQIANYREVAENLREQAEIFKDKVIPSFEAALASQERLYAEGKGNILQVWQTLRALYEAQTQGLMLWSNVISIRSELSILIGEAL